jgi:hypothetical protein
MCPQTPRLSPEYSDKAGLQTVITGRPLQIRPVMLNGHAGPATMGWIARGPPFWTRSWDETTSSQVFVRRRMRQRVSLTVVLSPLVQRVRRRPQPKGGVFAFAPPPVGAEGQPSRPPARPPYPPACDTCCRRPTFPGQRQHVAPEVSRLRQTQPP